MQQENELNAFNGHRSSNEELEIDFRYMALGGTLFISALNPDLINTCRGLVLPGLRSLAIDMSERIHDSDLPFALGKLQELLAALHHIKQHQQTLVNAPLLFIQVHDVHAFESISCLKHIELIDGFILPNFNVSNMQTYMNYYIPDKYYMPVLDSNFLALSTLPEVSEFLGRYRKNIISLRIGDCGLANLGLRRDCGHSYYDIGVINQSISQYISIFKPMGFNLTAPAYDCIGGHHQSVFESEIKLDLQQGLFGKTLTHASQIKIIDRLYQVTPDQYAIAERVLDPYSPASFEMAEQIHDKKILQQWAKYILARANVYGIQT